MNEFGETPRIYVWPLDHKEGTAFPEDFWSRVNIALSDANIEWETV